MSDFRIIDDPQLEVCCLVDLEQGRSLGPISVGPNRERELSQFVAVMPPAVLETDSYTLTRAWGEYWQREFQSLYETAAPMDPNPMGPAPDPVADAPVVAGSEHGAPTDEPPPPAPADAGLEEGPGETTTVIPCPACQGGQNPPKNAEGTILECNLCHGTHTYTVVTPA